ncbi:hypothetical protein ACLI4Z_08065 [Natrialbaceae archaeon A-arb3/5]
MSISVQIDENQSIRVAEDQIETDPPDQLAFTVEGVITMTEQVVGEFEGMSLNPSRIEVSVDESRTVEIDLTEAASLQLSSVDVGIATPDADDLPTGIDALRSSMDDPTEMTGVRPDALSFTVEGVVLDVPQETLEALAEGDPAIEALTFAVGDAVRSDGGSDETVVLEIVLLGYGITVHQDGTITVGSHETLSESTHL